MMVTASEKMNACHERLNKLGVPGGPPAWVVDRLYPVLDRLTLLPEDGTDLASEIHEVHEMCERAGVPPGSAGGRVEWLIKERDRLRAELEAERAQLAAEPNDAVKLALQVLSQELDPKTTTSAVRLALSVLREACK